MLIKYPDKILVNDVQAWSHFCTLCFLRGFSSEFVDYENNVITISFEKIFWTKKKMSIFFSRLENMHIFPIFFNFFLEYKLGKFQEFLFKQCFSSPALNLVS